MTLNIKDSSLAKFLLGVVALLFVLALCMYITGMLFLVGNGMSSDDATLLTAYQYWYYYGDDMRVQKSLLFSGLGSLLVPTFLGFLLFMPVKRSLFGDARFAKPKEINDSGILGDKGILVGKYKGKYMLFDGMQHVLLSAPTRSGKGVAVVIPNLLQWQESAVVLDIKLENFDMTSKVRSSAGHECYLFNPGSRGYKSHRYNPLFYISKDKNFRIDDIQKIGNMLYPDQPGTDPIWTATPRTLFTGIVLYLLETPGKLVTLGQVLRESLANGDGRDYFNQVISERKAAGNPLPGICERSLTAYTSIESANTRSGIITTFRSRLELFDNPLIDAATTGNDFDFRDLRKKKMTIYLGVTPDNLGRLAPLVNLFFQQLIDQNTQSLPSQDASIKYKVMLLLDEFTAIGKIPILSQGVSFIAGYWLRLLVIIQSPTQLVDTYGEAAAETFTTNHALNIVYPPKRTEMKIAKAISEWLGYETVKNKSKSRSTSWTKNSGGGSENTSDHGRALMLPQEITSMKKGTELVIMEDLPPVVANKAFFYSDPVFINRLKRVSPKCAAYGKQIPNQKQLEAIALAGEFSSEVPVIDIAAHESLVGVVQVPTVKLDADSATASNSGSRDFVAEDMPKLNTLTLENFAIDFSAAKAPELKAGELDEEALLAYADAISRAAGIDV
ncbi:type IV secretory system conjugative DNA transfer family protein [Metapseudomonas otitidis]|uniref:type IV secretory system conjugative DNA transfer family protein n=1 Tax=Metapseudomonas otitidis TaxID=319939 RepID=UPI001981E23B|nr:type IV secretory system conjugative DNA transfer family protein [Pseudomonas otitidis]